MLKLISLEERKQTKTINRLSAQRVKASNLRPSRAIVPTPILGLEPTYDPYCPPATDLGRKQDARQDSFNELQLRFLPADRIVASPLGHAHNPHPLFVISPSLSDEWARLKSNPSAAPLIAYVSVKLISRHQRAIQGIFFPSFIL